MSKTKKVEAKKIKKTVNKPYVFKIKFDDAEFETKAVSLHEALKEFVASPVFSTRVKTRIILTYSDGKVTRNNIYPAPRARRILNMLSLKDSSIEILANQLTMSLI